MNTPSRISKRLSEITGQSGSVSATRSLLRRPVWLWPSIGGLALGAVGWWMHRAVERAVRHAVAGHLGTVLNADIKALRIWRSEQELDARLIAADGPVVRLAGQLAALDGGGEGALLQS